MDNDLTMKAQLQVNSRPESLGCMLEELAVTTSYADSSQRKIYII